MLKPARAGEGARGREGLPSFALPTVAICILPSLWAGERLLVGASDGRVAPCWADGFGEGRSREGGALGEGAIGKSRLAWSKAAGPSDPALARDARKASRPPPLRGAILIGLCTAAALALAALELGPCELQLCEGRREPASDISVNSCDATARYDSYASCRACAASALPAQVAAVGG